MVLASLFYAQSEGGKFGTFKDPRDGKVYKWVKISDQIWMAENLRFKTDSGSWCWENKEQNCRSRGRLYNWAAAMKVSPPGWHLPSDEEWKEMEVALGLSKEKADQEGFRVDKDNILAGKIKQKNMWPSEYDGNPIMITNETGFAAVKTGLFSNDEFSHEGYTGWWTSDGNDTHAWIRHIGFFDNSIGRILNRKEFAFAVRCVKDMN
jgi:uncharacterized protein (TIGR02145 family)